ncbi:hypothetical protein N9Y81_05030, partial [Akkermansiaceae bacterium]|nr:hypothetical protein [Akkermansiaceae bacterium]
MLFTSLEFAILVAVTFFLFYGARGVSLQVGILLLASIIFYAVSSPWLTLLLVSSAIFTSWTSHQIWTATTPKRKQWVAAFGVGANLSVLAFFKYAGLLVESLENLAGQPFSAAEWIVMIPLPIGISFYTFQGI